MWLKTAETADRVDFFQFTNGHFTCETGFYKLNGRLRAHLELLILSFKCTPKLKNKVRVHMNKNIILIHVTQGFH